jgi:hypothetical protein
MQAIIAVGAETGTKVSVVRRIWTRTQSGCDRHRGQWSSDTTSYRVCPPAYHRLDLFALFAEPDKCLGHDAIIIACRTIRRGTVSCKPRRQETLFCGPNSCFFSPGLFLNYELRCFSAWKKLFCLKSNV